MAQTTFSQNPTSNSGPQKDGTSADNITHPQEQQTLPDRLPRSLIEWLARVNQRYLALNQERTNDNS